MEPANVRLSVADLSTIETLVEELAHPDEDRVLYAIDILDSLDKRNLITPLLLRHESSRVQVRALDALREARADIVQRWVPTVEKMVSDRNAEVRSAAIGTLASIRNEDAAGVARSLLEDHDARNRRDRGRRARGQREPGRQGLGAKGPLGTRGRYARVCQHSPSRPGGSYPDRWVILDPTTCSSRCCTTPTPR